MAQTVNNLPLVHEPWVQSLDQKDPLEKQMSTHSSILAWRIPYREEPGGLHRGTQSDKTDQLTPIYSSYTFMD